MSETHCEYCDKPLAKDERMIISALNGYAYAHEACIKERNAKRQAFTQRITNESAEIQHSQNQIRKDLK